MHAMQERSVYVSRSQYGRSEDVAEMTALSKRENRGINHSDCFSNDMSGGVTLETGDGGLWSMHKRGDSPVRVHVVRASWSNSLALSA